MPVPSQTINYDSIRTFVQDQLMPSFPDQIFEESALSKMMMMGDKISLDGKYVAGQKGGQFIQQPLEYGETEAVGTYENYETVSIQPADPFTSALFKTINYYGSVSISHDEILAVSGDLAIANLVTKKVENVRKSMKKQIAKDLYTGTGVKSVVGLDLAISDTGTYGNIPRTSDYEWWKAGVDSVAHTTDNMKNSLHASYLLTLLANGFAFTNRANEHFDLLLMRQETWDTYENIIQTLGLTINSSSSKIVKQMADAGFQAFEWRGIMMVVDNFIDSVEKPMYGVNTNYLTLYVHPQNNFIMTPFKESQDQPHTKVAQITAKLGLAISNPSHFYRWSNLNN